MGSQREKIYLRCGTIMTTERQWQEIEKQNLLMLAKNFAGQKTSVADIQRYTRWGYNRSWRMAEMALGRGVATRVTGIGGMVVTWSDTE
jgi:hypothetical protein